MQNNVISARQNSVFALIYRIAAFTGICSIAESFSYPLMLMLGIPALIAFVAAPLLMLTGYWLQAGWCRVIKRKRAESSRSYEQENSFYSFKSAIPVAIVSVFIAMICSRIADDVLRREAMKIGSFYDEGTAVPATVGLIAAALVMVGSFVWFFPYDRLLTGGGCFAGLAVTMVAFVIFGQVSPVMTGICIGVFAVCVLIGVNQYNIGRTYHGTVVAFLNLRSRGYNLLLCLGILAFFLVLLSGIYVVVVGVRTLVLLCIAAIFSSSSSTQGDIRDENEIRELTDNVSEYVYGTSEPTESLNYWLFLLFIILAVAALVYILVRRTDTVKRIISKLKDWLLALIDMLFRPVIDNISGGGEVFCNYVDVEVKLRDAKIREYREAERGRLTWREFLSELRSRRDQKEEFIYAYGVFVSELRKMPLFIRKSDTPREISARLRVNRKYQGSDSGSGSGSGDPTGDRRALIDRITAEYERLKYASGEPDAHTGEILDELCGLIRESL